MQPQRTSTSKPSKPPMLKHTGIGIGIVARHQQTKTQQKYLYFSTKTQASKTNNHYAKTVNNVSISINQQILTSHIFCCVSKTETFTHNIANSKKSKER